MSFDATPPPAPQLPPVGTSQPAYDAPAAPGLAPTLAPGSSDKSFIATWLLSYLLGIFGADRFYLGKIGTAIIKLVTLGGLGIWWLVDLIITLTGNATDARGNKVRGKGREPMIAWIVTGVLVLAGWGLGAANGSAGSHPVASVATPASETEAATPAETEAATPSTPSEAVTPTAAAPAEPELTLAQRNAVDKAGTYLTYLPFSREGLIAQLEFDKFSPEDASFAVDHVTVDWNEQAAKKAQSYLDTMSFSRDQLAGQLEFDKFTPDQIAAGLAAVGY